MWYFVVAELKLKLNPFGSSILHPPSSVCPFWVSVLGEGENHYYDGENEDERIE